MSLQDASLDDPSTLVTLSRTLRLFIIIEDLVSTNKALRAIWEERRAANLALIRDLVSTKLGACSYPCPCTI